MQNLPLQSRTPEGGNQNGGDETSSPDSGEGGGGGGRERAGRGRRREGGSELRVRSSESERFVRTKLWRSKPPFSFPLEFLIGNELARAGITFLPSSGFANNGK